MSGVAGKTAATANTPCAVYCIPALQAWGSCKNSRLCGWKRPKMQKRSIVWLRMTALLGTRGAGRRNPRKPLGVSAAQRLVHCTQRFQLPLCAPLDASSRRFLNHTNGRFCPGAPLQPHKRQFLRRTAPHRTALRTALCLTQQRRAPAKAGNVQGGVVVLERRQPGKGQAR